MSIMSQLEFQLDFSQSEKVLSQYILENGENVLNLNAKELAKHTYTSPATVVRLCQKLGLKGYSEFKIKYSAELKSDSNINNRIDVNYPFNKDDSLSIICENLQRMYNEVIEDTLSLLNINEVEKIVDLMIKSNTIYLFGVSNSAFSALEFENRMSRIGASMRFKILEGEQYLSVYNATENDVAIIISYTGETKSMIEIAKIIKKTKMPIIAITSVGKNQLSAYADYIINTSSRENAGNKIAPYASKVSTEFILDILYSRYFNKEYDKNLEFKLKSTRMFEDRKIKSPIASD